MRPRAPYPRVCIVQAVMKQYRVPFFDGLARALAERQVELRVVYSAPGRADRAKGDNAELDPRYGRKVEVVRLGERLVWQKAWRALAGAGHVIVEHANRHLINYPLLVRSRIGGARLAFWGHGRNRMAPAETLAEKWKRRTVARADWWFAYTDGAARYLEAHGVPPHRITTVQNCVDLGAFAAALARVEDGQRPSARRALGIAPSARVAVSCGALYQEKDLPRLIAAGERIAARLPDFVLLIAGGGPERPWLERAIAGKPWCRYLGPQFGDDKARLFRVSDVVLNPGVVGLVVLDALAAGLPLLTCDVPGHGPEIEYLIPGETGLVTPADDRAFAEAAVALLCDEGRLAAMRRSARATAPRYSIDGMVRRFADGVAAWMRCAS